MKLLGLILLMAAAGQLSAQRSEFVEYLLQLQYIAEPVHRNIMAAFAQARAQLSEDLTALNDESVNEITDGLRAVIAIRDRTEDAAAEATTEENAACINGAVENWPTNLETVGADIQQCADNHVDEIYNHTEQFHNYIQENNRLAFNAQNMVLNIFTDLNPLTQTDEITPAVEAQIDAIYEEFEGTVQPEVNRRLLEISNLRRSVPSEVHTCVNEAIATFNNTALAIVDAVAAC